MDEWLVFELQRLYPQIYLACHTDHIRASSTAWRLSSRDASILAHLKLSESVSPRELAAHLDVVASTLSAALKRLAELGYITIMPESNDKRRRDLRLTELGARAMSSTSVLDTARVRELLEKLSEDERKTAVAGLSLLARAARQLKEEKE
jgi:DNA-binding MarR family transcriptional regulator